MGEWTCPKCGTTWEAEVWEYSDGDEIELQCAECNAFFDATINIEAIYDFTFDED